MAWGKKKEPDPPPDKPQKVMCGHVWGSCGGRWQHVCGQWIYPGQSHTHICYTCSNN